MRWKWRHKPPLMLGQLGFMFCDCTFVISIMSCFVKILGHSPRSRYQIWLGLFAFKKPSLLDG